ncbi:NAD(P)/FAD-dependent oxidoreductase [Streptomyces antarcticus]|uniref:NAD(P)/FAD-dependent oxidoreductase n=1 Tax=Streptomyces antarcticus TaxID=2996458 RepID=UPI00226F7FC6|nr:MULTISPECIES: NAD(P)/FAD-dependent oxidoreductase [unclassified Streptomyces]MCY0943885.1 NAD(P)/FAD-dependent oxidoreductase [Streptomyces sp. H34-AA3]MCY0950924.1 NAD(P)/FAD-dependent oxidoreductase [Streptomyces sp. H27-S2]MCZ4082656.1 NAD(P)/FAD-dependent oxidoreductase [Streptomyces sp. H34-S5]
MLSSSHHAAHHADVVIVGAGVSGLAAAQHLIAAGVTVTVLEAAGDPGGRMATASADGFRLDRIGQLLNTSYTELARTPGLEALTLRPFAPGVLVHADGKQLRAGALTPARALASGSLDQARLSAALGRLAALPEEKLLARPERTAHTALRSRGLPPRTVNAVLRPLLAALLRDPDLTTSSRVADLALRTFARGRLAVPEGGAATLPGLLAAALPPGTVHTGVRVRSVATNLVTTEEHGEFGCRSVILATGARAAAGLLPGLRVPAFHEVTVLHHATAGPLPWDGSLLLDAAREWPVSHTAVMSAVDPTRAPAGRSLVTTTVLGPPPPPRTVASRLARLYETPTREWELLAVHHTPEAVPAMPAPYDARRPVRVLAGLYVCGDHRDTNTVQGALHSARRAATAVLRDFGIPLPAAQEPALPAAA